MKGNIKQTKWVKHSGLCRKMMQKMRAVCSKFLFCVFRSMAQKCLRSRVKPQKYHTLWLPCTIQENLGPNTYWDSAHAPKLLGLCRCKKLSLYTYALVSIQTSKHFAVSNLAKT